MEKELSIIIEGQDIMFKRNITYFRNPVMSPVPDVATLEQIIAFYLHLFCCFSIYHEEGQPCFADLRLDIDYISPAYL